MFSDGDLPMPVSLRIHQATDGRFVATGLLMGDEFAPTEISSQTLREIKLRELLASLFKDYNPDDPPHWAKFGSLVAMMAKTSAKAGHVAERRPRGPDNEALQSFARTYLAELARQPRRAMSAAAKAHDVSRATANRWAQECRQLGYLPHKEA